jgi:hypothetical protein
MAVCVFSPLRSSFLTDLRPRIEEIWRECHDIVTLPPCRIEAVVAAWSVRVPCVSQPLTGCLRTDRERPTRLAEALLDRVRYCPCADDCHRYWSWSRASSSQVGARCCGSGSAADDTDLTTPRAITPRRPVQVFTLGCLPARHHNFRASGGLR